MSGFNGRVFVSGDIGSLGPRLRGRSRRAGGGAPGVGDASAAVRPRVASWPRGPRPEAMRRDAVSSPCVDADRASDPGCPARLVHRPTLPCGRRGPASTPTRPRSSGRSPRPGTAAGCVPSAASPISRTVRSGAWGRRTTGSPGPGGPVEATALEPAETIPARLVRRRGSRSPPPAGRPAPARTRHRPRSGPLGRSDDDRDARRGDARRDRARPVGPRPVGFARVGARPARGRAGDRYGGTGRRVGHAPVGRRGRRVRGGGPDVGSTRRGAATRRGGRRPGAGPFAARRCDGWPSS